MSSPEEELASTSQEKGMSVFLFQLGVGWYAIPTELVETVLPNDMRRTLVPGAPPHIEGVVNHRGHALAVFLLDVFLGLAREEQPPRLLVLSAAGMSAAIPVQAIGGVRIASQDDLRPPEAEMAHTLNLLELELGPVQVLDLPALLQAAAAR